MAIELPLKDYPGFVQNPEEMSGFGLAMKCMMERGRSLVKHESWQYAGSKQWSTRFHYFIAFDNDVDAVAFKLKYHEA